MKDKIRVGLVFGGQSEEHAVSIRSTETILAHFDQDKYEVTPIGIDQNGSWHFLNLTEVPSFRKGESPSGILKPPSKKYFSPCVLRDQFDLIFPLLHGPNGEDGTMQGLLRLANIPFVGADVLSSALCMDKEMMKIVLRSANLPIAPYLSLKRRDPIDLKSIENQLGLPLFIKPARLGSSLGVNKATSLEELDGSIKKAFEYDDRILIESFIKGKEIECSVLGNQDPIASLPGEIIPNYEFHSFEAKCLDPNGIDFIIPAPLGDAKNREIQLLSIQAFKTLRCEGMARVDLFIDERGKLIINEINTLPGFTPTSLYPKMWEASGLPLSKLLDELIELAFEKYSRIPF